MTNRLIKVTGACLVAAGLLAGGVSTAQLIKKAPTTIQNKTVTPQPPATTPGSLDVTFKANLKEGAVSALAVSGDVIYVGGQRLLVRLKKDGSIDTNFRPPSGIGPDREVMALAEYTAGRLLVGGDFLRYDGVTVNGLVRLLPGGSIDTSFQTGVGFSPYSGTPRIHAIVVQSDGKILVGGSFVKYNNTPAVGLVRLLPNGALDTSFKPPWSNGNTGIVAIALDSAGRIMIGGGFILEPDGSYKESLARLNANGSLDTTFCYTCFKPEGQIYGINVNAAGEIFIAGTINRFRVQNAYKEANQWARYKTDGSLGDFYTTSHDSSQRVYPDVFTMARDAQDRFVLGGSFTKYQNKPAGNLVRILKNGVVDSNFNTGTGTDGVVKAIVVQSDGKILVGGGFNKFNGADTGRLIRIHP